MKGLVSSTDSNPEIEKWTTVFECGAIRIRVGFQKAEVSRRAKDVKQKVLRFQVDFLFYPEITG